MIRRENLPSRGSRTPFSNTRVKKQILLIVACFAAIYLVTTPPETPDKIDSASLRGSTSSRVEKGYASSRTELPPVSERIEEQTIGSWGQPTMENRVKPSGAFVDEAEPNIRQPPPPKAYPITDEIMQKQMKLEDQQIHDLEQKYLEDEPLRQQNEKELKVTVEDAKLDVEEAEEEKIAKAFPVLDNSLKVAEGGMKDYLDELLKKKGINKEEIEKVEEVVKERLEDEVLSQFIHKADDIAKEKDDEIDEVVMEDRNILPGVEEIEKDVERMEGFFIEDMDAEIDKAAKKIGDSIPSVMDKIEKDVVKEELGIDIEKEQKEEKELNETVDDAKMDVEEAEEIKIAKTMLNLDQSLKKHEGGMKTYLDEMLKMKGVEGKKIEEVEEEVTERLEEEVVSGLIHKADMIAEETDKEIDEVVEGDKKNLDGLEKIEKDIEENEVLFIEEMESDIDKAAKKIENSIPSVLDRIEKDVLKKKLGIDLAKEHHDEDELKVTVEDAKEDIEETEEIKVAKSMLVMDKFINKAEGVMKTYFDELLQKKGVEEKEIEEVEKAVRQRLEEEITNSFTHKADMILEETDHGIDEVVKADKKVLHGTEEMKKDVEKNEAFFIDEMNLEIDNAAKNIEDSIPTILSKIMKDIVKEKLGIDMETEDIKVKYAEGEEQENTSTKDDEDKKEKSAEDEENWKKDIGHDKKTKESSVANKEKQGKGGSEKTKEADAKKETLTKKSDIRNQVAEEIDTNKEQNIQEKEPKKEKGKQLVLDKDASDKVLLEVARKEAKEKQTNNLISAEVNSNREDKEDEKIDNE